MEKVSINKIKKIVISLIIFLGLIILSNNVYASDDIIVLLDPGHGATDAGAVKNGVIEDQVNWIVATKVKEIFDNTDGITGILSRGQYENPTLSARGDYANEVGADLVISFHFNSSTSSVLRGSEMYVTGNTKDSRYYQSSSILAREITTQLSRIGIAPHSIMPKLRLSQDGEVYQDGTITDYYGIIRYPMFYGIPSVLVEHSFLSNYYDAAMLKTGSGYNYDMLYKIAEADANAIIKHKELFRENYYGEINTDLKKINISQNASGAEYIYGEIDVAEWIERVATTPKGTPTMTLKSIDGTYLSELYVSYREGITYYFDKYINYLDPNKDYYIEVELVSSKNSAPLSSKTQIANIRKQGTVGQVGDKDFDINDKIISFNSVKYVGTINTDLKTINISQNSNGAEYVYGEIDIAEWVNGSCKTPNGLPKMTLKSLDETYSSEVFIKYKSGITYYFDKYIDNLDQSKQYYIEVELTGKDNNAAEERKVQTAKIRKTGVLGFVNESEVSVNKNKLTFKTNEYIGTVNTDLRTMNLSENANGAEYIYGEIDIAKWVSGICNVPNITPKMTLKSLDGTYSSEIFVLYRTGITYYFDKYINNIDQTKQYYIEVELVDKNNLAKEEQKVQTAKIRKNGILGNVKEHVLSVSKNIFTFESNEYEGIIKTDLKIIKIGDNASGAEYIYGEIDIKEIVNGKEMAPKGLPKMTLKSLDGTYSSEIFVLYRSGTTYYFDKFIDSINKEKEYYIEVELTGKDNIAEESYKIQKANIRPQKETIVIDNYKMLFDEVTIFFELIEKVKSISPLNVEVEEDNKKEINEENKNTENLENNIETNIEETNIVK